MGTLAGKALDGDGMSMVSAEERLRRINFTPTVLTIPSRVRGPAICLEERAEEEVQRVAAAGVEATETAGDADLKKEQPKTVTEIEPEAAKFVRTCPLMDAEQKDKALVREVARCRDKVA